MKVFYALATIVFCSGDAVQAQVDSRFDGIWTGIETCTATSAVKPDQEKAIPRPHNTTIAIAKSGTMIGIIGGVCPGRYEHAHRNGNTLNFGAADCHLTVTLSPDGKTLVEQGNCHYATTYAVRMGTGDWWPVTWTPLAVSATLHKSK